MQPIRAIGLGIAGLLVLWWWTAGDRENNRHINRAIYPAFRAIEDQCLAERFPHETVRCKRALELLQQCSGSEPSCSADTYYSKLMDLGFDLPTLYEPGYKPK